MNDDWSVVAYLLANFTIAMRLTEDDAMMTAIIHCNGSETLMRGVILVVWPLSP